MTVDVINIAVDRQKFMTLTGELSWQRLAPETISRFRYMVVPAKI